MAQHARRPAAPSTVRRKQARPAPPRAHAPQAKPRKRPGKKGGRLSRWLPALVVGGLLMLLLGGASVVGAGLLVYASGRVPPNTQSLGVDIGWLPQDEAAAALARALTQITVQDGTRTWKIDAAQLGVMLDAEATAARAANGGLAAYFTGQTVPPVLSVNADSLRDGLVALAPQLELAPRNAGIRLFNGAVQPIPAEVGRQLDIHATAAALTANPAGVLAKGTLPLVMIEVVPRVPDAAPLVAQAETLLASPLTLRVYDPFDGDFLTWWAQPQTWAAWLIAQEAPDSELGLRLALDPAGVQAFVAQQAATLPSHQQVRTNDALDALNKAIGRLAATATVRLYESDRAHTVRAGETITSIAWAYGIPYPYIQQANGGIEALAVGQRLTIPSREVFFEQPVVVDKRIVVSISGNWTKVYENGQLKWDWVSSTGINSSPTWPGVYQIISHEENAYAGNWNLYMPWFMGVYKPIPGSDFTNGFHGFPTRGGGQLLWEANLGTRTTYGCILLSDTNARQLYDWAENGVVVEIQP